MQQARGAVHVEGTRASSQLLLLEATKRLGYLLLRNDTHRHLLELARRIVLFERLRRGVERLRFGLALAPLVLDGFLGGEALLGVELKQLLDEVLGLLRDVVPPRRGEVVPN